VAITLDINGEKKSIDVPPDTILLYVLRNDLGLNAAKYGCGFGQCGACTVVVDGRAIRSCTTRAGEVAGKTITTLEALGTVDKPGPLQRAFIAEQAAQCGYCVAGMMMSAHALLARNANPGEADIRAALAGNLCRCGTHNRIVGAVQRAAKERAT
jgi:aerobic-type carbon monoxide dehydrogenase small subunit (CoxS/CutS family)